ncbi:MAG TPA: DUF2817 domain-containing protein [Pyrinomonadaceae bacterium]|nr:DUF2817 domain-containing protein [Pyrinomonadaceae bacterium]
MKRKKLLLTAVASVALAASASLFVWGGAYERLTTRLREDTRGAIAAARQGASPAATRQARRDLELGLSCLKRQIRASVFGTGRRNILVLGAVHGDEPASATLAEAFIASLERESPPEDLTVVVVPVVNPDGIQAQTRYNGCGVDVNRNFPTASWNADAEDARYNPGKSPASEPETRLIIELVEKYKPELIVSVHAPLHCVNWDGPAERVAEAMAEANGYPLKAGIGYPTPGSLGAYAGVERRIPAVTLELPPTTSDETIRLNVNALRAALKHLAAPPRQEGTAYDLL